MPFTSPTRQSIVFANFVLATRKKFETAFPVLGVGDLTWSLVLELYIHHEIERRIPITALCVRIGAPPSTALRHVSALIDGGIFQREPDPLDRRRAFVRLAPSVLTALDEFLSAQFRRAQAVFQDCSEIAPQHQS